MRLSSPVKVLVRADGGAGREVGMGHVIKCLALVERLRHFMDIRPVFLVNRDRVCVRKIREAGYPVRVLDPRRGIEHRWLAVRNLVGRIRPGIVILDVLSTSERHILGLRHLTQLVVHFDDAGTGGRLADLVINTVGAAGAGNGAEGPRGQYFVGARYERMPESFRRYHAKPKVVQADLAMILVTLGGCDYFNEMPRYIRALRALPGKMRVVILAGPAFTNLREIRSELSRAGDRFALVQDPEDVAALMYRADLAISAGGSTLWQLAAVGTPAIAICQYRHQLSNAERLSRAGAAVNLGMYDAVSARVLVSTVRRLAADHGRRTRMSKAGKAYVDAQGTERVARLVLRRYRAKASNGSS